MADWRAPLHADAERKHNIVTLVRYDLDDFVGAILNPHPYRAALRAVLDLHPPRQAGTLTPWDLRCVGCSMEGVTAVEWPCKNVLAIARELGIEETGDAVRG